MRSQPLRATLYAGIGRLQSYPLTLSVPPVDADQCAVLAAELARVGLPASADDSAHPTRRLCELTIGAHAALLREAAFFFPEAAQIVQADPPRGKFSIAVPKIPTGAELSAELFGKLTNWCAQVATGRTAIDGWVGAIRKELAETPRTITTAAHFARAAYELEMPMLEWRSSFLQVGYGSNGIVLSGSITQFSPSIGVHYAREKSWTNALLASAGLPVAEGGLVNDVADARKKAAAIGYPVVIKPGDRDGGQAVSSGIVSVDELEQAYVRARAVSEKVLLEKHIDGLDYRLLFFRDELLVAIERTPGGVVGNGRDTIERLLHDLNTAREGSTLLHQVKFNREAEIMLRRQHLTLEDVPEDGQFVALRRAANHALGGNVRLATDIHPDNLDLARRAMRLLRLDIAGLDLILPDISKSWHETGGVVCEINAQPFIGEPITRDYYKEILQALVPSGGRIPLVLVVGTLEPETIAALASKVPGLAIAGANGTLREGRPLAPKGATWQQAVQAALYDQATNAVLCMLDPTKPVPVLSPVDRFSAAFVLDAPERGINTALAALLGRAQQVHALGALTAPLKAAGIKSSTIQAADIAAALAALLAGETIAPPAKPKPAPRGKAPPASRKRR